RELSARHVAAGGNAEAPELLRCAAVEDDELLSLAHSLGELLRLDLGDVVHRLDLLAEVLARDVAAPLRGEAVGHPAIDAAVEQCLEGFGRDHAWHGSLPCGFQRATSPHAT